MVYRKSKYHVFFALLQFKKGQIFRKSLLSLEVCLKIVLALFVLATLTDI